MAVRNLLVAGAALLFGGGCGAGGPETGSIDIEKVFDVRTSFGPEFEVITVGPGGIDPRLLGPQQLPEGVAFNPPRCAKYASGQMLPKDLAGNMAAVSAEGDGNRFIAIALETSEPVPFDPAAVDECRHVTFTLGNLSGVVDVVDSPQVEGANTLATHRVIEARVGDSSSVGEVYTYAAYLGDYLVLVTANQLVDPTEPAVPVDADRAKRLFTEAVAAVRS